MVSRGQVVVVGLSVLAGVASAVIALTLSAPTGSDDDGCRPDLQRFVAPGCGISASDTGVGEARSLWGRIDCQKRSRHRRLRPGGDRFHRASGKPQRNRSFRRLRVLRGDDHFGARCELGRNERRYGEGGDRGTFALFREGQRRITFLSLRLPRSFPIKTRHWQTVLQMKQTQPYAGSDAAPALELQVRRGRLHLHTFWKRLWSTRIVRRQWMRIALDVTYSSDPALGSVQLYVRGRTVRRSPRFRVRTLSPATAAGHGLQAGAPIPSHLRIGLYRNRNAPCLRGRCTVHVDNVQVTQPIGVTAPIDG